MDSEGILLRDCIQNAGLQQVHPGQLGVAPYLSGAKLKRTQSARHMYMQVPVRDGHVR